MSSHCLVQFVWLEADHVRVLFDYIVNVALYVTFAYLLVGFEQLSLLLFPAEKQ
jgi:hypothetical protein